MCETTERVGNTLDSSRFHFRQIRLRPVRPPGDGEGTPTGGSCTTRSYKFNPTEMTMIPSIPAIPERQVGNTALRSAPAPRRKFEKKVRIGEPDPRESQPATSSART